MVLVDCRDWSHRLTARQPERWVVPHKSGHLSKTADTRAIAQSSFHLLCWHQLIWRKFSVKNKIMISWSLFHSFSHQWVLNQSCISDSSFRVWNAERSMVTVVFLCSWAIWSASVRDTLHALAFVVIYGYSWSNVVIVTQDLEEVSMSHQKYLWYIYSTLEQHIF